ncbi:ATP-binding protein [Roseateles cellulosilyticus]|uniref:Helix-turn-helix transcriptional regulator n=1 Tax=Pelomonas cellulosilytica TaxID=2906762 RepID=A0ABS8XXM1_9BURK|nr:winged helix-turn-helix domain-containing protein [Pelomonas sp. P8]MCE4556567.1 helix-turn-helix transcriptional regulator [Pelomonas sp. P8]
MRIDTSGGLPALAFGRFVLDRASKQLLEDGKVLRLGGRAFDLLCALAERSGEVLSRAELEARVWPRTVVEETSLRVHISALRKALGDGVGGARYIANVPGRGYSFVVPVVALASEQPEAMQEAVAVVLGPVPPARRTHNLPGRLSHAIGRLTVTYALSERLARQRLVSIVAPGGMGKTTVALAVAESQLERFADGVWFVDLAPLSDPARVPLALASALGISVSSTDPWANLREPLRESRMLIVLDNCEHVIDGAASLAERVLREAPHIRILATSREALDAEGEWVHRLAALEAPDPAEPTPLEQARTFAAVQLFAERAGANSDSFALDEANIAVVAHLCRQLDGMPLAIELAAARIDSLGLHGLAARLEEMFTLLTRGRRTVLPRHRTLQALLDWSHDLLTDGERVVLRRLSIFRSAFSLQSAAAVLADAELSAQAVVDGVLGLAGKSLVAVDVNGHAVMHRLLYTTRTYAAEKLASSGEARRLALAHATHCRDVLLQSVPQRDTQPIGEWLQSYGRMMDDIRAGLDWAFSPAGEALLGVQLTVAAADLVYELGLIDEFRGWVDIAMEAVGTLQPPQPGLELRLCAARGFLGAQTRGRHFAHDVHVRRTLELATQLDSKAQRIEALFALCAKAFGIGDYREVGKVARSIRQYVPEPDDPAAVLLSDRFLALSHHYLGQHEAAKPLTERVLHYPAGNAYRQYIGHIPRSVSMGILQARILWMQGACDRAVERAAQAEAHAESDNPLALSQALAMGTIPIALWRGDNERAQVLVERLRRHAERHSQAYWQSWARSFEKVLTVRAGGGNLRLGMELGPMESLSGMGELDMLGTLVESSVSSIGVERADSGVVGWCAPEILRAHAENRLRGAPDQAVAAEKELTRSLAMARAQNALSWELRSATSLARLWQEQGRRQRAYGMLSEVYQRFEEGHATADVSAARELIAELG